MGRAGRHSRHYQSTDTTLKVGPGGSRDFLGMRDEGQHDGEEDQAQVSCSKSQVTKMHEASMLVPEALYFSN